MAGLGSAIVPRAESALEKRAREAEEDRYNAKRRKIAEVREKQEEEIKRNVEASKQRLEAASQRFTAEINRLPLGLPLQFDFYYSEPLPVAERSIFSLTNAAKLERFLQDYSPLDIDTANELLEPRVNELEEFKRARVGEYLRAVNDEKEAERRRFRRELPTIDLWGWDSGTVGWLDGYLSQHGYRFLDGNTMYRSPEFMARMVPQLRTNLPVVLQESTDDWLRDYLEGKRYYLPQTMASYEDLLGRDAVMQGIRAEFDRRRLQQSKDEKEKPYVVETEPRESKSKAEAPAAALPDEDAQMAPVFDPVNPAVLERLRKFIKEKQATLPLEEEDL